MNQCEKAKEIHEIKNGMAGSRSWGKNGKKTKLNKEKGIAYKVSPQAPPRGDA
jgi:hypothetical protein